MNDVARHLVRHDLATLAYRTQRALEGAPENFGSFEAGSGVRTPRELLHHMNDVLQMVVAALREAPRVRATELESLSAELERFHGTLGSLSELFEETHEIQEATLDRLVQGPLADAMTHVGQLAMLRRLAGSPVAPRNYYRAEIDTENVGSDQPD